MDSINFKDLCAALAMHALLSNWDFNNEVDIGYIAEVSSDIAHSMVDQRIEQ